MENTNFWNGFRKMAAKSAGVFKNLMIELEDKKSKEQKKTIPVEEA